MKTRDQLRAEKANTLVGGLKPELLDEYVGELRELAPMVAGNGLGPALAFLKARGGTARNAIYDHLSAWISETVYGEKGDLLTTVITQPAHKLMRAHEESLLFASWLRRFAEARDPKAKKS